jgi:hypothetical protein
VNDTSFFTFSGTCPYFHYYIDNVRRAPNGKYPHRAIEIIDGGSPGGFLGTFEGMRFVPGEELAAESTVTDDTGTYFAFPNVNRTSEGNFCLVKQA